MANEQLFHDMLKQRRLGMGAGNRKKTKKYTTSKQWLYPYQWERKYAKEISALQKLFTVPLTDHLVNNLQRWINEYNDTVNVDHITNTAEALHMAEGLWKLKTDSFSSELKILIEAEQQRLIQVYGTNAPQVRVMISSVGNGVSSWNLKQQQKFMKDILGVEFFTTEPWETEVIETWSETNYELIKSLSTEYIKSANTIVSEGVQFGKTYNEIIKEIRKLDDTIEGWRARLIARDQVGKLNGALTKRRMKDAGIDMYTWMTANDERVRSKHKTLNNNVMRWDDNTVYSDNGGKTWKPRTSDMFIGIPGQDIQCRCTAIPFFDDMIEQVDKEIEEELAA